MSEVTRSIAELADPGQISFADLGRHRLKDLADPVGLFQVVHPDLVQEFPRVRLDAVPGTLPKQVTIFIGREAELREAAGHVAAGRRLVTISGSGGSGKTRLALQVAAEAVDRFSDGAWLVELGSVTCSSRRPGPRVRPYRSRRPLLPPWPLDSGDGGDKVHKGQGQRDPSRPRPPHVFADWRRRVPFVDLRTLRSAHRRADARARHKGAVGEAAAQFRRRASAAMSRRGPVAYRMAKAALSGPMRLTYRLDVDGLDNLPTDGGVILAANHRSFMDSIFLALASPQPVAFVAKAEYFDHPVTRWIFRSTGQIPLRRGSPVGAREALAAASEVLVDGGTLGIYPEGTRSRDGKLHRGKLGPARLAAATGAAIVPVGLIGTDQVQLPDERLPHVFRPVTVRFGPAVRPGSGEGCSAVKRLRSTTDEIMQEISALSGAEYVDFYA